MKVSKFFTLTIIALLASWNAQAQDIHFSQFGVSNLTLNPATVGVMTCNARVSLIYRNQWASALGDKAFNTFGVGGEMKFNAGKSDFWGAGVNVWTDIAGTSKFASTQAALSASYLKKIGGRRANDHFLVAGVQVGFIQQSIRTNELTWGSQWSGSQFDRSLDSDNALNGAPTNNVNFDLSAGLMWFSSFGKDGKSNLYVGIGFQHLTKANISFLNTEEALYTKYTIHGGADIRIKKRLAIVPVFATWVQGPSVQLNVGAGVKFDFSKRAQSSQAFTLGMNFRGASAFNGFMADAIIPRLEMRFGSHRIGFAFDVNISSLTAATRNNGAFELGYVWTLCGSKGRRLGCPTF